MFQARDLMINVRTNSTMNPKAIPGTTHQILSILKFLPPLVSYGLGRQQSCNKRNPQCYWLKQNIKSSLNKCKKDGSSYKKMKRAVQGGDLSALSTISGIRQNLSRFQRVNDWQKKNSGTEFIILRETPNLFPNAQSRHLIASSTKLSQLPYQVDPFDSLDRPIQWLQCLPYLLQKQ